MRFLPVSTNVILVELADLDATLMLFEALDRAPVEGIEEIVPAARTLMIRFRPEIVAAEALARHLARLDLAQVSRGLGQLIEIPVRYDGEDLSEVAELLGVTPEEVIRRHTAAEYTVAFAGFAPGFAYMVAPGADLEVPRRTTPRTRIPAGAVGLAGPFSGIYPRASPGGWQILGTTPLAMFDLARERPALLQPGDRVRFHGPRPGTRPRRRQTRAPLRNPRQRSGGSLACGSLLLERRWCSRISVALGLLVRAFRPRAHWTVGRLRPRTGWWAIHATRPASRSRSAVSRSRRSRPR